MPDDNEFSRVLFLAVDAWRYGLRDDRQQSDLQKSLAEAISAAAVKSGLDQSAWVIQPAGDGLLALVADSHAESKLVDPFIRELNTWLVRHNHDLVPAARLRLRVAVHHGAMVPAELGFAAKGPVLVCRLRDAGPVREALDSVPQANLVLAISPQIFDDLICGRHTSLSAADFLEKEIVDAKKGFQSKVWVRVPDVTAERLAELTSPEVLAVSLGFTEPPDVRPDFVARVLNGSIDAAGLPIPETPQQVGDGFLIQLSPAVLGARVLGVWIDHLHKKLLEYAPDVRMAVGIGLARGRVAARREADELAMSDAAVRVLATASRGRLVVVVSGHVHRAIVCEPGRLLMPGSYRRAEAGSDSWLRVPGYSIPPEPPSEPAGLARTKRPYDDGDGTARSSNGAGQGPSAKIKHGTFNGPFVVGSFTQNEGRANE